MKLWAGAVVLAALSAVTSASARVDIAGAEDAGSASQDAAPPSPSPAETGCVERLPAGKPRPKLRESFPARGTSGWAAVLEVELEHGQGESVLPPGVELNLEAYEAKSLEQAHFALTDPDGGAGTTLTVESNGDRKKSRLRIAFVPLPSKPGRNELTLPPVPITLARASGELVRLCTLPHSIVVEDPIANVPSASPRKNPPPRRQIEEWTAAKHAAYVSAVALVVGALAAWLIGKWLKRPKPVPPPPPPRPPWEEALEQLHDIRHAGLVTAGRYAEHFDRVSDSVRSYLGKRYGFEGLESTTRETLNVLREVTPAIAVLEDVTRFLRQADLVKFARLTPSEEECSLCLERAERIVRATIPGPTLAEPAESGTSLTGDAA
jgi:hypothetical protein